MEKEKEKIKFDLKFVNSKIVLFKIFNIKIPATSLLFLLIFLVGQNRYFFVITILLIIFSSYLETKNETLKTFLYKITYIFKDRFLLPQKNSYKKKYNK